MRDTVPGEVWTSSSVYHPLILFSRVPSSYRFLQEQHVLTFTPSKLPLTALKPRAVPAEIYVGPTHLYIVYR